MKRNVFLHVKGEGFPAMEFSQNYDAQKFYEEMVAEGVKEKLIETDEVYIEVEIKEFGEVDKTFIAFIRENFMEYDNTKEMDFFEVSPIPKTNVKEKKPMTIEEHILKLANSPVVESFLPTGIAKRLNVPLKDVESELNKLIKEGKIQKLLTLLCHNEDCLRVLDKKSDVNHFGNEYSCKYCGEEMEEVEPGFIQEIYSGMDK